MVKSKGIEVQTLPKGLGEIYNDILLSIGFCLIFPIPLGDNFKRKLSGSLWLIPLVCMLVGIMSLFVGWMVWEFFAIWHLTIFVMIIFNLIIGGCLHEDGFADVMDSLGVVGSEDIFSKRLSVMKDAHIGVYGVMGLIVLFFSRFLSMSQLEGRELLVAMIIVLPLSRMIFSLLLGFVSTARESGLAYIAGKPSLGVTALSIFFACLPSVIFVVQIEHVMVLWLTVLLIFVVLRYGSMRLIGGINGDFCGAGVIICELILWWVIVFISNNYVFWYRGLI